MMLNIEGLRPRGSSGSNPDETDGVDHLCTHLGQTTAISQRALVHVQAGERRCAGARLSTTYHMMWIDRVVSLATDSAPEGIFVAYVNSKPALDLFWVKFACHNISLAINTSCLRCIPPRTELYQQTPPLTANSAWYEVRVNSWNVPTYMIAKLTFVPVTLSLTMFTRLQGNHGTLAIDKP